MLDEFDLLLQITCSRKDGGRHERTVFQSNADPLHSVIFELRIKRRDAGHVNDSANTFPEPNFQCDAITKLNLG